MFILCMLWKKTFSKIHCVFLTAPPPENVSRLVPPKKCHDSPPPKSFNYENHIQVLRHATFSDHGGGGSLGLLTFFFLNRSLTGQQLANSGGGELKKHPVQRTQDLICYAFISDSLNSKFNLSISSYQNPLFPLKFRN